MTLAVQEFWEREAGGRHHRAITLAGLESAVEAAYEEFRYESPLALPKEVMDALRLLNNFEFRV